MSRRRLERLVRDGRRSGVMRGSVKGVGVRVIYQLTSTNVQISAGRCGSTSAAAGTLYALCATGAVCCRHQDQRRCCCGASGKFSMRVTSTGLREPNGVALAPQAALVLLLIGAAERRRLLPLRAQPPRIGRTDVVTGGAGVRHRRGRAPTRRRAAWMCQQPPHLSLRARTLRSSFLTLQLATLTTSFFSSAMAALCVRFAVGWRQTTAWAWPVAREMAGVSGCRMRRAAWLALCRSRAGAGWRRNLCC